MLCNYLIIIASVITAIATTFIAYYAFASNRLTKEIKSISDQSNKKYNELIVALIAASLTDINTGSLEKQLSDNFDNLYKIFKDKLKL